MKDFGKTIGNDSNCGLRIFSSLRVGPAARANPLCSWFFGLWIAVLPLGRRILLSRCRDAVDDRYADQTENAYANPLQRHMKQVGTERQSDNQYDVADDVNLE